LCFLCRREPKVGIGREEKDSEDLPQAGGKETIKKRRSWEKDLNWDRQGYKKRQLNP